MNRRRVTRRAWLGLGAAGAGGAGVFNAGTMRWVEAIFGDRPHGISAAGRISSSR
jgi:hypothetical protein